MDHSVCEWCNPAIWNTFCERRVSVHITQCYSSRLRMRLQVISSRAILPCSALSREVESANPLDQQRISGSFQANNCTLQILSPSRLKLAHQIQYIKFAAKFFGLFEAFGEVIAIFESSGHRCSTQEGRMPIIWTHDLRPLWGSLSTTSPCGSMPSQQ